MAALIFVIGIGAFILYGIIRAVCEVCIEPRPPRGYSHKQCRDWYYNKRWETIIDTTEYNNENYINDDMETIIKDDRVENYDIQIEACTRLIKLLEGELKEENDTKKQATILSKQITTLEKLNRLMEKRGKLD